MKKRTIAAGLLALTLILGANIGTAWAYFSTYATAKGGLTVTVDSPPPTPHESFSDWTKKVTVSIDEGEVPVYVRVKEFHGTLFNGAEIDVEGIDQSDGKWTYNKEDGYWYYSDILNVGDETGEIDFKIENIPEGEYTDDDTFDVVVVAESTPVLYKADGTAYADWTSKVDVVDTTGGDK